MKASRFARKYETVADLKISPSALYDLADEMGHERTLYPAEAIAAIFKEAAEQYVSRDRAREIADALIAPQIEAEAEAAAQAEAAERAEAEAIPDGPPPELPEPEPAEPVDFLLPAFDQAIDKLNELSTKHSDKFLGSTHSPSDIEAIAEFLFHIAQTKARAAA